VTQPDEPDRIVIRDNRKIDPVTGEARKVSPAPAGPQQEPEPAAEPASEPMVEAALLDERTRDLQRVQAEYANYRKRADRDRLAAGELAIGRALTELLPVLDDLDRAKAHGDLTGAFKAVADKLEGVTAKLGLAAFGQVGDPFDPAIHEAVLHDESDSVTVPTCTTVMRPGYQHHERLLRPAMVGVTDPTTWAPAPAEAEPTPEAEPTSASDDSATGAEPQEDVAPDPAKDNPAPTGE
jgi:molecular chaperone GrpE